MCDAPNIVHPVMELWSIKNQAEQHEIQTRTDFTYDQYCNWLLSAASVYDAMFVTKEAPFWPKNWAVIFTIGGNRFYDMQEDMLTYDINVSVEML